MSKDLWNEKMETISREELERIRLERLGTQLKYCYSHSEYYKKKFDKVGFKPEDINSWEDFRKLPVLMDKEDERAGQQESMERFGHPFGMHLCTAPEKVIAANATSGTTGLPTFSYSFTKQDLDTLIEGMCRVYWLIGFRPGDRILYAFPISGGISTSGGIWTNPLRHMGCLPLEIGAEAGVERVLRMATLATPTVLMCSPSFATSL
ncbi:MAG: phenylacetate--CoA ligase family protein, partial [Pseudomonadota bacterium]